MSRLPQINGDDGTWGGVLNDFLSQSLASDGKLKTDSVTASQILDGSITESELASNSVTNTKIIDGAITNSKITNSTITNSKLVDGTITNSKLLDATITESKLDPTLAATINATPPVISVNTKTGAVVLDKTDIGLTNVDNTSDTEKPISVLQRAVLDNKVSKGELVINVKDYGAVGDGEIDDTVVIAAAITAASSLGGSIYIPAGIYIANINLRSGINITGASTDSTIILGKISVINCKGVAVSNLTINGRNMSSTNDCIYIEGGVRCSFNNLFLLNPKRRGISILSVNASNPSFFHVFNNIQIDAPGADWGIYLYASNNSWMSGCVFTSVNMKGYNSNPLKNGVYIDADSTSDSVSHIFNSCFVEVLDITSSTCWYLGSRSGKIGLIDTSAESALIGYKILGDGMFSIGASCSGTTTKWDVQGYNHSIFSQHYCRQDSVIYSNIESSIENSSLILGDPRWHRVSISTTYDYQKVLIFKDLTYGATGFVMNGDGQVQFLRGIVIPQKNVSINTTVNNLLDQIIISGGTNLTHTLPNPTTASFVLPGKIYTVSNINSTPVTLISAGTSKLISGASSYTVVPYGSVNLTTDGVNWVAMPGNMATPTSVTGNAGTVTGATFTTALTVDTGTVDLSGNVANTSHLTIGAGDVSVSGTNTGDQDLSGKENVGVAASLVANYLPLTGGTMTGAINTFNLLPATTNTYTLGDATYYYSNTYTTRQYLNSAAYMDGGTGGTIKVVITNGIDITGNNSGNQILLRPVGAPTTYVTTMGANWNYDKPFYINVTGGGSVSGDILAATASDTALMRGKLGIGTIVPTHTLTLPSTSTGIALYATSDQVTNYERVRTYWNSSVYTILTEKGGSGIARNISIGGTGFSTINPAGVFLPVQAATASAPAYVKGGIYFDTTLNKLMVGGATGWETITSA